MAGSDAKEHIIYPLENRVVNPIVLLARDLGNAVAVQCQNSGSTG
jgi:hypothetical protein